VKGSAHNEQQRAAGARKSSADASAVEAAAVLNRELTPEEVEAAVRELGRMAGRNGVRGELFVALLCSKIAEAEAVVSVNKKK
jgi:hypothetical protein